MNDVLLSPRTVCNITFQTQLQQAEVARYVVVDTLDTNVDILRHGGLAEFSSEAIRREIGKLSQ